MVHGTRLPRATFSSTLSLALVAAASVVTFAACDPSDTPGPDPDVVLTNLAPGILLADEEFGGWTLAERMASAEAPAVADVDRTWFERLAGRYEYSDGSITTVALTPEGLTAAWGEADPVRLFPEDSTSYFTRAGERFEFELDDGDDVAGLVWSGDFGAFAAERLE